MSRRRFNPRLVKKHRTYTVDEVARRFGAHKNTIRAWIRAGLPTLDHRRPILILGEDLRTFVQARRTAKKRRCKPGQMYCVRCRLPKSPAGGMADYRPLTDSVGNLTGICPDCSTLMNRCVSLARLPEIVGILDVTFPQALAHLTEINDSSVNSDLR